MRYRILGACRDTGDDISLVVEASNELEAETMASRQGVLISTVEPLPPLALSARRWVVVLAICAGVLLPLLVTTAFYLGRVSSVRSVGPEAARHSSKDPDLSDQAAKPASPAAGWPTTRILLRPFSRTGSPPLSPTTLPRPAPDMFSEVSIRRAPPVTLPNIGSRRNRAVSTPTTTPRASSVSRQVADPSPQPQPPVPKVDQIENLVKVLSDPDRSMASRWAAIQSLGECGAAAEPAIPALLEFLQRSPDSNTRARVFAAFGGIGKPAVPVLIRFLKDQHDYNDGNYRRPNGADCDAVCALKSLATVGRDAREASSVIADILSRLHPAPPSKQSHVFTIVGRPERSVPSAPGGHMWCELICWTLEKINPDPKVTVPAVRKQLASLYLKSPLSRNSDFFGPTEGDRLLHVLRILGPEAKDAVPELIMLLDRCREAPGRDLSSLVRGIVEVLGNIGAPAEPAIPHMRPFLIGNGGLREAELAIQRIKQDIETKRK